MTPRAAAEANVPQRILSLRLRGLRNLSPLELTPGPCFNVIWGDNGAGKSNLLEAIDYLATLRSFRHANTAELIQQGQDSAELSARVEAELSPRSYRIRLTREQPRRVELDGKRPRSRSDYLCTFHTVLFCPSDMALVTGAPELRRHYLDRILEQFDPIYASTLAAYTEALRSRNRLLKHDTPNLNAVRAYDDLLASAGSVIGQTRAALMAQITPRIEAAFRDIGGEQLPLSVSYRPRVEPDVNALRAALNDAIKKDMARGFTADGPHADELVFTLRDGAAKHYGSQGQQRALVLALKVAELHELTQRVGRIPILLLDDVSSELDRTRNERLFDLLGRLGGQVFLTTTHRDHILLRDNRVDFHTVGGAIEPPRPI